ncbi:MAG: ABC transporter substrate-binding protein, partial [Pirellulales bacterium]|nr:ABC transporter substrate-binding protein [Pirellulales bacterium]
MIRFLTQIVPALLLITGLTGPAAAASPTSAESLVCEPQAAPAGITTTHAIAMHGAPKYGPAFTHFDYVNPDAPKGGTLKVSAGGAFDSFNPFIARGTPTGGAIYETLMTSSSDEPFSMYGLLAEKLEYPGDRSWAIFHINPNARWHDGTPVTAHDVVFSLDVLKTKGHPQFRFYYADIAGAEALDDQRVKCTFSNPENPELILITGQLTILPKHYWQDRDFSKTTLDPPLGSSPY